MKEGQGRRTGLVDKMKMILDKMIYVRIETTTSSSYINSWKFNLEEERGSWRIREVAGAGRSSWGANGNWRIREVAGGSER